MATEAEFWGRNPELGDVRKTRIRVTREALVAASASDPDLRVSLGMQTMAELASDDTLDRLARMLK